MWGYYGSKSKVVDYYSPPKYDKIIEPFAGTAQYSLKYWDRDILLVDKYDVIISIWKWLQQCSKNDILSLPILKYGETVNNYQWDCQEAKWLMGFIIVGASATPKITASKWKTVLRPNTIPYKLHLISESLDKIRHWKCVCGDYTQIENQTATWFIDPPYQIGGQYYKYNKIDYIQLKKWIDTLDGHIIVCGNNNDTWLPFQPLIKMRGNLKNTIECVYEKF